MKKTTLAITVFLCCSLAASGQFPVHVDSLYAFIRHNSVFRNNVDWQKVDKQFARDLAAAESPEDTMSCFVRVLQELDDVHTQMYLNNRYYGHYKVFDEKDLTRLQLLNEKSIATTNQIYTTTLNRHYAYVRVPGFQAHNPELIKQYAQALNDSICRFDPTITKGFLIDLRLNGGGNLYPMLAGLSPLLGETTVGYETDPDGRIVREWKIQGADFVIGDYQATNIKPTRKVDYQNIPVAVLLGPVTRSSGSMVGIAFRKRKKTLLIGEPTADGYTTSNGFFQFAPNLFMNFATHFVADRQKQIYKSAVDPDLTIHNGDNFEDLSQDKKIKAALTWLKSARQ